MPGQRRRRIAGLTGCVLLPLPYRSSKFRLLVLAQRSPCLSWSGFMPGHLEQPGSRHSNPAAVKISSRPSDFSGLVLHGRREVFALHQAGVNARILDPTFLGPIPCTCALTTSRPLTTKICTDMHMYGHAFRPIRDACRSHPPPHRRGAARRRTAGERHRRAGGDPPVRRLPPPAHPARRRASSRCGRTGSGASIRSGRSRFASSTRGSRTTGSCGRRASTASAPRSRNDASDRGPAEGSNANE